MFPAIALLAVLADTQPHEMIYVSTSDDLATIVANAEDNAELVLADGTYLPAGSATNALEINKSLTIRAVNPGKAVLDGNKTRRVLSIQGPKHVTIVGVAITNGLVENENRGGGVRINMPGGMVHFQNSDIFANQVTWKFGAVGGGVHIDDAILVEFWNCKIFSNHVMGGDPSAKCDPGLPTDHSDCGAGLSAKGGAESSVIADATTRIYNNTGSAADCYPADLSPACGHSNQV